MLDTIQTDIHDQLSDALLKLKGGNTTEHPIETATEPLSDTTTLFVPTATDNPNHYIVPKDDSLGQIADIAVADKNSCNKVDDEWGMEYQSPQLPTTGEALPFHLWESLAYDIALGSPSDEHLASAYGISVQELTKIRYNTYFDKLLVAKQKEVEEVGDRASTVTKFRVIASMGMREFMRRVTSPNTSDKDFHSLFRTALEMGELMPTQGKGLEIEVGSGSSGTTFNIYGIPGLDHLGPMGKVIGGTNSVSIPDEPIEYAEEVDTTPTVTTKTTMDIEYSEIDSTSNKVIMDLL